MKTPKGEEAGQSTSLLGGYRNKDIFGIFRLDSAGADEAIILAPGDLEAFLEGAGIDPRFTRYQVEFMTPENPFNAGFYRLLGIKIPVDGEKVSSRALSGDGETTVSDFIGQFMASQKKELEIERGCELLYPIAKKEGGLLVIAASQPEIFAISAS
jgi:hypothetical protein